MESRWIYWIPLYEILEERGFDVNLVNARHIQHMQKAFTLMNVLSTNVVSDITGLTDMKIIRWILGGERDPLKLAEHRHHLCAHFFGFDEK